MNNKTYSDYGPEWETETFRQKFDLTNIYKKIFNKKKEIEIIDMRKGGEEINPIDKYCGIDRLIRYKDGNTISVSEKIRKHQWIDHNDFTMEIMNGNGTEGEWYHLFSNYTLYSWSNEQETKVQRYVLIDNLALKRIIYNMEEGIDTFKRLKNGKYGKAEFAVIPLNIIKNAIVKEEYES